MERGEVDAPIVLGGVTVHPGDLVLGDDDGVVQSQAMLAQGASALKVFGVPAAEFD